MVTSIITLGHQHIGPDHPAPSTGVYWQFRPAHTQKRPHVHPTDSPICTAEVMSCIDGVCLGNIFVILIIDSYYSYTILDQEFISYSRFNKVMYYCVTIQLCLLNE